MKKLMTNEVERLISMIENAYALSMNVQDTADETCEYLELAEEVAGESAEFLALWEEDWGSFGDPEEADHELRALAEYLNEAYAEARKEEAEFLYRLDSGQSL